ncbi:uncharacterized protein isoform X2 [Rhodnius prolixus]|uniref:uncharacterized protein isoform X2 n=1 Tax=Rhodnius prolixus TaxID=13249 RepID=UPI003D18A7D7
MSPKDLFIFLFVFCCHTYNTETVSVRTSLDPSKHVQNDNNSSNLNNLKSTSSSSIHSSLISNSTIIVPIEGGGGSHLDLLEKPFTEDNFNKVTESRKISARKGVVFSESDGLSSTVAPKQSSSSTNRTPTLNTTVQITTEASTAKIDSNLSKTTNSTVTSTTQKSILSTKKKPLFTMISDDHVTIESESFIESPTTGKDYVLPIVLIILALPVLLFIIKLIYKRGTEFTERQQYHRMYLIDGMYNTSFRWVMRS